LISLHRPLPPVLAAGAFLKNTICSIEGCQAVLSPPIGNLDSAEAIAGFEAAAAELLAEMAAPPQLFAHDLHPDFYSSRWSQAQNAPALAVQHHHAHIAAVAAEHGHDGPIIGLALDGFGLGPGNQSWGGELLLVDGPDFRRIGHLAEIRQPGGDVAAREPWRMASAILHRLGRAAEIPAHFSAHAASAMLPTILSKGLNSPPTSSAGRLFDAACGLLGVHPVAEFEGQAPMALEAMVTAPRILTGGWSLESGVLDCLPLMENLIGRDAADGADLFHGTLIAALTDWAAQAAEAHGLQRIALGGGCFFNKVLREGLSASLDALGLEPLLPRQASPGDPGVSLGQAWIAALAADRA
jgi:hydrogenase maturation protein HypF